MKVVFVTCYIYRITHFSNLSVILFYYFYCCKPKFITKILMSFYKYFMYSKLFMQNLQFILITKIYKDLEQINILFIY